mmetsp:Transcript_19904/g.55446  ORF Transcript_19904/g.55446 Transcript_19904/m.55446 type:complete len:80 (+) Transcript_19904:221-460(+)
METTTSHNMFHGNVASKIVPDCHRKRKRKRKRTHSNSNDTNSIIWATAVLCDEAEEAATEAILPVAQTVAHATLVGWVL